MRLEKGICTVSYIVRILHQFLPLYVMRSTEDRAVNLDSRPTICPPRRRFGSVASPAFRSELIVCSWNEPTSYEDIPFDDLAALS